MTTPDTSISSIASTARYEVIEKTGTRHIRWLDDDETFISSMSIDKPDALFAYHFPMIQPLVLIDAPRDVMLIGLGGGTQPKFIHRYLPQLRLLAVEIDPVMVELAHTQFGLPADDERLEVVIADGAVFMSDCVAQCDLILSDAYGDNSQIVEALHTEAFYQACHRVLRTGGIMTVNILRPGPDWGIGYMNMLRRIFDTVYVTMIAADQCVLTLCKSPLGPDWTAIAERAQAYDPSLGLDLPEFVKAFPRVDANPAPSSCTTP